MELDHVRKPEEIRDLEGARRGEVVVDGEDLGVGAEGSGHFVEETELREGNPLRGLVGDVESVRVRTEMEVGCHPTSAVDCLGDGGVVSSYLVPSFSGDHWGGLADCEGDLLSQKGALGCSLEQFVSLSNAEARNVSAVGPDFPESL
jgi:hypothetical protein